MVKAVFVHIPKTAGTSFRDALCRGFGEEHVSPAFGASHLTESEATALRRYQIICGHISMVDAWRLFPDAALLTILRDPVERSLSWYHYARRAPSQDLDDVKAAQTHDVEEFFSLPVDLTFRNIFNRQVRQLGDHVLNRNVDMASALQKSRDVLKRFAWVGRQEMLGEDLPRLGTVFPEMAGISAKTLNVTRDVTETSRLPEGLRAKILRYNLFDAQLVT